MYCGKCGKKLPKNSTICSGCGNNQSNVTENNVNQISFSKVVVTLCGLVATFILLTKGFDLTKLESVSGNSVAEAYYQTMGYGMMALGLVTFMLMIFLTSKMNK